MFGRNQTARSLIKPEPEIRDIPIVDVFMALENLRDAVSGGSRFGINTDFSYCRISNFNFSSRSMPEINFEGSVLHRCSFNSSELCRANLRGADLRGCSFDMAHLRASDIRGALFTTELLAANNLRHIICDDWQLPWLIGNPTFSRPTFSRHEISP